MKLMNRKFRVTRLEVLLNRFVGAALAANDRKPVVFFAAKAAPTNLFNKTSGFVTRNF